MCSWKRRDARLVPYIARFICHMYPASSSPRGGYIAIGSSSGSCACQNAMLMSYNASTRERPPLVFLIDAALEMMILMRLRGAVPAIVSNRIATSRLRTNCPFAPSVITSSHSHLSLLPRALAIGTRSTDVCSLHRAQFRLPTFTKCGDNRSPVLWSKTGLSSVSCVAT